MKTHITILAWLHIVLALPCLLLGFAIMFGFGALGLFDIHSLPIVGGFGVALGGFILLFAIPGLLLGWGLLQLRPWARIFGIVVSILSLFGAHTLGLSTILGIYGLIIFFNPETVQLFERGY